MNVLFLILTIAIVLAALLLVGVVLLQNGKGDGLASNFVAGNQTFGVRQTADILEKITWGLVAFIIVLSIITAFATGSNNGADLDVTNKIENTVPAQPAFPSAPIQSVDPAAVPDAPAPDAE